MQVRQHEVSASVYPSFLARRSIHLLTQPREKYPHRREDPKGDTDDIRQDREERSDEARGDPIVCSDEAEDLERVFERRAQEPRSHQQAVRPGEEDKRVGALGWRFGPFGFGVCY